MKLIRNKEYIVDNNYYLVYGDTTKYRDSHIFMFCGKDITDYGDNNNGYTKEYCIPFFAMILRRNGNYKPDHIQYYNKPTGTRFLIRNDMSLFELTEEEVIQHIILESI